MEGSNYFTLAFVKELMSSLESSMAAYRRLPSNPAISSKPRAKLRPLIIVLCSLMEISYDNPDIDFTALELPLRECGEICNSFNQDLEDFNVLLRLIERDFPKLSCYVSVLNIAIVNAKLHTLFCNHNGPTKDMLDNCQDRLQETKMDLEDGLIGPRSTRIGLDICDALSVKLESKTSRSLQPDQLSAINHTTNYRIKRCSNDTTLRLQVLLLTTLEDSTGSKVADDIVSILQVYTYSSPLLVQVLGEGVNIPEASKLLALCQELNGVRKNSIQEIGDYLAEPVLGVWTAHRRLLTRVKNLEKSPVQERLLTRAKEFASQIPRITSSTIEPNTLVQLLQDFRRLCWEFQAKIPENADEKWLAASSAKIIARQNIFLIVMGILRDGDEIGDTKRYFEVELIEVENGFRRLLERY